MSAFDDLERQLRAAAGSRQRAARRAWWMLVPVLALSLAAVLVLAGERSPRPSEEREASQPAPAGTWTPTLGDERRGHPSIERSAVPPEQAATFAVLRRPQSRSDRGPAVRRLLRSLSAGTVDGVRVDAIRLLDRRAGTATILLPVARFRANPRDAGDDVRDALCLLSGSQAAGSGLTCGTLEDVLRGRNRWTLPPRGLAPDGAVRVKVRVRGGKTITAPVRNNYFDLHRPGSEQHAGIAAPRWIGRDGREIRP